MVWLWRLGQESIGYDQERYVVKDRILGANIVELATLLQPQRKPRRQEKSRQQARDGKKHRTEDNTIELFAI